MEAAPFFAFLGDFLAFTTLGFFGEAAFDFFELFSLVTFGLAVLAGFEGLAVLAGFSGAGAGATGGVSAGKVAGTADLAGLVETFFFEGPFLAALFFTGAFFFAGAFFAAGFAGFTGAGLILKDPAAPLPLL